jgi:hypothetical protein
MELTDKLKAVLDKVSARLAESEIVAGEFGYFLFEQLKEQGIVSGTYGQNVIDVGAFEYLIGYKLRTHTLGGMNQDYIATCRTHVSGKMREDLEERELFDRIAIDYLREQFEGKEVTKSELDKAASSYVRERAPRLSAVRQAVLTGTLLSTLEREVKIAREPVKIGDYRREDIEEALGKI